MQDWKIQDQTVWVENAGPNTHTQPFYSPLGFCPGPPGEPTPET